MSEWQPIETAPKDGSYFLITSSDYGTIKKAHYSHSKWWSLSETDTEKFSWKEKQLLWMPLPELPKKEHYCVKQRGTFDSTWICYTKESGSLFLIHKQSNWEVPIEYCPFCGKKADG